MSHSYEDTISALFEFTTMFTPPGDKRQLGETGKWCDNGEEMNE